MIIFNYFLRLRAPSNLIYHSVISHNQKIISEFQPFLKNKLKVSPFKKNNFPKIKSLEQLSITQKLLSSSIIMSKEKDQNLPGIM